MIQKYNLKTILFARHRELFVCLMLAAATVSVYWQVHRYDFINFDDDQYVTENPHVRDGLTSDGIIWAFTSYHAGNWHPLTWISHMLDVRLFGMKAGFHHLVNLFFHLLNTLLLFYIFSRMTGSPWRSGFMAALFALHPLHVESVAWISERKDVLSTFFWMLAMWSYFRYVERPAPRRYIPVLLFFIGGLLSKPMVITLPFVLLLLDFWPLYRFPFQSCGECRKSSYFTLILEKIPLLIFVPVSSVITIIAQNQADAMTSLGALPFKTRIFNALVSYAGYLGKMIWPSKLAILYPYRLAYSWQMVGGALGILLLISYAAAKNIHRRPYWIAGWLWYVGTLVPVIGIIQVGRQSMADRYTYIPLIGIFIMISWTIPDPTANRPHKRIWLASSAVVMLSVLAVVAWKQTGYWKNSITLFKHAVAETRDNYLAHNNLGMAFLARGQKDKAAKQFTKAAAINPAYMDPHFHLGNLLYQEGKTDMAVYHLMQALKLDRNEPRIYYWLGMAFLKKGQVNRAIHQFQRAAALEPDFLEAHAHLADAFYQQGRMDEAAGQYQIILRLKPDSAEAHADLANAFAAQGRIDEAIEQNIQALKIKPNLPEVYNNLGVAYISRGQISKAIACFQEALKIKPDYSSARRNLESALLMKK